MIIWKSWPYQSLHCAWKHAIFCIYWTMHDNINSILFPFLLGQFFNPSCWFCMQPVKEDTFTLAKKIELLEVSKRFQGSFWNLLRLKSLLICCNKQLKTWIICRKLLGEGLETCSTDDLQQLENQLGRSLTRIRARKVCLIN